MRRGSVVTDDGQALVKDVIASAEKKKEWSPSRPYETRLDAVAMDEAHYFRVTSR